MMQPTPDAVDQSVIVTKGADYYDITCLECGHGLRAFVGASLVDDATALFLMRHECEAEKYGINIAG
jgi:hypothetical protein